MPPPGAFRFGIQQRRTVRGPGELAVELERSAADTLKRVLRPPLADVDWKSEPGTERLTTFLETKTVWHPKGA